MLTRLACPSCGRLELASGLGRGDDMPNCPRCGVPYVLEDLASGSGTVILAPKPPATRKAGGRGPMVLALALVASLVTLILVIGSVGYLGQLYDRNEPKAAATHEADPVVSETSTTRDGLKTVVQTHRSGQTTIRTVPAP